MERIIYKEKAFAIQVAVFEVYREMGCGFLEAVYQEWLKVVSKPSIRIKFKAEESIQPQEYI